MKYKIGNENLFKESYRQGGEFRHAPKKRPIDRKPSKVALWVAVDGTRHYETTGIDGWTDEQIAGIPWEVKKS